MCGHRPADHAAFAVADDEGVGVAEGADHTGHVGCRRGEVVAAGGLVGFTVAAQVHGGEAQVLALEGGEQLVPVEPAAAEAVDEQDERGGAGSLDGGMQTNAPGVHEQVLRGSGLGHGVTGGSR
jgi:hypothetical protein